MNISSPPSPTLHISGFLPLSFFLSFSCQLLLRVPAPLRPGERGAGSERRVHRRRLHAVASGGGGAATAPGFNKSLLGSATGRRRCSANATTTAVNNAAASPPPHRPPPTFSTFYSYFTYSAATLVTLCTAGRAAPLKGGKAVGPRGGGGLCGR